MSLLLTSYKIIVSQNDCLVLDSRLIAGELGIEHCALRQTIEKYINEIQEFGVVAFQMSKPLEGSSGGRPERYCYLNEEQATLVPVCELALFVLAIPTTPLISYRVNF